MNTILKKHSGKLIIVLFAFLFGASVVYSQQAGQENNEGVVVTDHVKGNPEAALVLAKHGDFQCPFCAQAYPVVDQIIEEFGEDVRFEYKHLPLTQIHPYATPAAVAAEAAGQQDKFFEYHDLLYDRQQEWSRAGNPNAFFISYAEDLGLDMDLFKQHQNASLLKEKVRTETRESLRAGYNSTPTFTLNGERIPYSGYEGLRAIIASELGQAADAVEFDLSDTHSGM